MLALEYRLGNGRNGKKRYTKRQDKFKTKRELPLKKTSLPTGYFEYLPVSADDQARGIYVLDAGYTGVPPGVSYPPYRHPEGYHFQWENGRTLIEHHLVYIGRGSGIFESELSGSCKVGAGDAFVLFPGVWHRYRPDPQTGWDEYWVGLGGDRVTHFLPPPVFQPRAPLLTVGYIPALVGAFVELSDVIKRAEPGHQLAQVALALNIISQVQNRILVADPRLDRSHQIIQGAQQYFASHVTETIETGFLARKLNVSPSWLRHTFKDITGTSPRQYLLELRLNLARFLLLNSNLTVQRVAEEVGFDNSYYFMRLFRQKIGQTPTQWRKERKG